MEGYLALILHAHLPYVRHPEHEKFLEETWLFEAITESYVPLLQRLEQWKHEGIRAPITLTLTPTLCAMLQDPLLQERYERHLNGLIELTDKEVHRTLWEKPLHALALFYHERLSWIRKFYQAKQRNLISGFSALQNSGHIEIITCAATHAVLPLLADHAPSVRAQILVARDHHRACFGRDPRGIWLPECAYSEGLEEALKEADLRWFAVDTHGLLHARPRPRYGIFAPILTESGLAVFGRDLESARQVWSRNEGYPGDPRYRDFYRDIGFDLDFDYIKEYLPGSDKRAFTGIKYYRIGAGESGKQVYEWDPALRAADEHAGLFLNGRMAQISRLREIMGQPPIVLCPYDAELFGHWWYEGPEFLDLFVRKAFYDQKVFSFITPGDYLERHPTHQVATPSASSWGEEGYWRVWLNEKNEWVYRHLHAAQEQMTELARRFAAPNLLQERALKQAGSELLLAQSSDWPFIMKTGTSPEYAKRRVKEHLLRFNTIYEQLGNGEIDEKLLAELEKRDNPFPEIQWRYWG